MIEKTIEGFRLSPQQKHLWLLQQDDPAPYQATCRVAISGSIDPARLDTALAHVAASHELLQTSLECVSSVALPIQVITGERPALQVYNLSAIPPAQQEEELAALEAAQQDDSGPLRFSLILLAPDRALLNITLPALYADEAGLVNLVGALSQSYAAGGRSYAVGGQTNDEQALQYADLAEWQSDMLESEEHAGEHAYWRQRLEAARAALPLPGESGEVSVHFWPHELALPLDEHLCTAIRSTAHRHGTSVETVFLACWQAALQCLTGQERPTIGIAAEGRSYEELEGMPGLFARYLPLRADLPPGAPFMSWLRHLDAMCEEALARQEYFSWDLLAGVPAAQQFFPACFVVQRPPPSFHAAGVTFAVESAHATTERYTVRLAVEPGAERIQAALSYDSMRYAAPAAERLAEELVTLLRSATDSPATPLDELEIVGPRERGYLARGWARSNAPFPSGVCLHQLLEAQLARTPVAVAVEMGDLRWTYTELHERANRLAHALRAAGAGPEVPIGVCMERTPDLLVALLGILKAGSAFVALDPLFPPERLHAILDETAAPIVLTQQSLRDRLLPHTAQLISLDSDQGMLEQHESTPLGVDVQGHNLAYIIYTSGSTGTPKGVMIEHRSLVNYLYWANGTLFGDVEWLPVTSRLSFDACLKQLFVPLMRGQAVWFLPDDVLVQPGALIAALRTHEHIALNVVPSVWAPLLKALRGDAPLPNLTHLYIGGEACTDELLAATFAALPHVQVWNLYGPSETTANACAAHLHPGDTVTIGYPVANMQLYVLDAHRHLVPFGAAGELYVGGVGVARGYLARPELTAERFTDSPFEETKSTRLYRTGDLVRYTAEGALEFLGRADDQIKLHGVRIEPGEIEALLCRHAAVAEAAVTVREDTPGEKRLVAYVTTTDDRRPTTEDRGLKIEDSRLDAEAELSSILHPPSSTESVVGGQWSVVEELRAFLKQHLPDYMLPAAIGVLDELPRLPSGKLNRQALPAPETLQAAQPYIAPRTPIEAILADLWTEVLEVERIGVLDDFFASGGHSLRATQLAARVRKLFQVDLSLRSLFEAATIEEMARLVVAHETQPGQAETIARTMQQIKTMTPEERERLLLQKHRNEA